MRACVCISVFVSVCQCVFACVSIPHAPDKALFLVLQKHIVRLENLPVVRCVDQIQVDVVQAEATNNKGKIWAPVSLDVSSV